MSALQRREVLHRDGDVLTHAFLLEEGWIARVRANAGGSAAYTALHIAGDLVAVDGVLTPVFADEIFAVTAVVVLKVHVEQLRTEAVKDANVALAIATFLAAETTFLRTALFAVGRQSSQERLCTFFLQARERLVAAGLLASGENSFRLPLTQGQLADATGLTSVHVNRTLKQLREAGWLTFQEGVVRMIDVVAIERACATP